MKHKPEQLIRVDVSPFCYFGVYECRDCMGHDIYYRLLQQECGKKFKEANQQ